MNHASQAGPLGQCMNDASSVSQLSSFSLTDEDEIRRLVGTSPNKSCDLDPLPTWLLKENINTFLPVLTSIVNTSLSSGSFPSTIKDAIVTPILKKPSLDKNDYKNYRPVSNVPFLSKLIEKIALDRVNDHICKSNLSQKFQSAYRSGHSTETALLRVKSDIMNAFDNRRAVFLVLLDLSAAFDTIDYSTLLTRLHDVFGISGQVYDFFESYLVGRTSRVKVASELSDPQQLEFGLPQGSVIGPQMFSYFTQPLAKIIERYPRVKFHFYADDSQLYITVDPRNPDDISEALSILSSCIMDIKHWMSNNMLQLNENKTEFIVCATKGYQHHLSDVSLQVGNERIPPSATIKNLGVNFDSAMMMSDHVTSICQSANFHIRNLSRIRIYIDQNTCHAAVRALITSRLDYANSLLFGISRKDCNRLQCIQNRAAKLIYHASKYDHVTPLINDLHWLSVQNRITFKLLTLVYKSITDSAPLYLSELIHLYSPTRTLRSASNKRLLQVPRTRTSSGDKGFYAAAAQLWNNLPYSIRHSSSLASFKCTLKTNLFNN